MTVKPERIVLGSGKLYVMEFAGDVPENSVVETTDYQIGFIKGGASLEYKPEFMTCEDDLGLVKKVILTQEKATLKSGIMTWCGRTLKKLCATARVTEDSVQKKRTVKIGGIGNQDGKSYLIRFVHTDPKDGALRITIVGTNQAGFSLSFAKDKETVIDAEFEATPMDEEGTLILYEEEVKGD